MSYATIVIIYKDFVLCLYACLKAFLPLPSLEVVLIPFVIALPSHWMIYTMLGTIGTLIGGAIGYAIAYYFGYHFLQHLASHEDIQKGEALMNRYGMLAVFIGGITPIPDFLLAYLAGFTHMSFYRFILMDGLARCLRSILVCLALLKLDTVLDIERYGTIFSFLIVVVLFGRWFWSKYKTVHKSEQY